MFISQIRASTDDRSPWGDFWFSSVGQGTMSGMRVSADSAMQLSAVFRAVVLVSGHMALMPIKFYKAGTRTRIMKHPLLTLLNGRANRWQNAMEWREMLQGHLELRGNAYNEIMTDARGQITELVPIHPDKIKPVMLVNGDWRYQITDPDGSQRIVSRGQIWHLKILSANGITGISVIECARESFGLGLAAQGYGGRFFANDARPGGWIEVPSGFENKEARQKFRESIQEAQSGANRGKNMVLDRGMQYHEIAVSNADAQFLETRKFNVSDIARWFGVPPHKIGDLDRSTNNNIEQQALEYWQDGLQPRAARWEASIKADLLLDDEEIDVEFDFDVLLRTDSVSRGNYLTKMTNGGILTRNEARAVEGRAPLEGLDEPLRPLNMATQSEDDAADDNDGDEGKTGSKKQNPQDQQDDNAPASRMNMLLQANADRLARRFARDRKVAMDDAPIIAAAMAIPLAKAEQFCSLVEGADLRDDEQTLAGMLMRMSKHN
jgi:HK97 family phage portal protein